MEVRWLLLVAGWCLLGSCVISQNVDGTETPVATEPSISKKKLGGNCQTNEECETAHSKCDTRHGKCACGHSHPVEIDVDTCLPTVRFNESCTHAQQCTKHIPQSACINGVCACQKGHLMTNSSEGIVSCVEKARPAPEYPVDTTMIGVLVGLMLMFIVMCVVLRMFSKARFREHRTIFNSPRLMKLSLAKTRADRRSSHASIAGSRPVSRAGSRAGSRHASIQSGLNMVNKSPTHSHKGSKESIIQNNVHGKSDGSPVKIEPLIKVESPKSPKDKLETITDNSIAAV